MSKVSRFLILAVVTAICMMTACDKEQKHGGVNNVGNLRFDSIACDTLVNLTMDSDSPSCRISLKMMYAIGDNAEKVNDTLVRCGILSPDYLSLSDMKIKPREAVDSFMHRYIDDYRVFYTNIFRDNPNTRQANLSYELRTWVEDGGNGIALYFAEISNCVGETTSEYTIVKNILTSNGHFMSYRDVFVPGSEKQLSDIIASHLCQQVGVNTIEELNEQGYFLNGEPYASLNFALRKDSVEFIYITGEIADRDKGEIHLTIDYADLKHLMKRFLDEG